MALKKASILIVIESFFDGGAEMFAINLANELSRTHKIFFLELYPYSTTKKRQLSRLETRKVKLLQAGKTWFFDSFLKISGSENFYIRNTKSRLGRFYIAFKKKQIESFINKNEIQIVNSHSWDSDLYLSALKKKTDFKMISTLHGHHQLLENSRESFQKVTQTILSSLDAVIYASPQQAATLDKYSFPINKRRKIFIGRNILLRSHITKFRQGECLHLVMVSRGIVEKGWEQAILSVIDLQKKYPGCLRLCLVGEGKYLQSLSEKFQHANIDFKGYSDEVEAIVSEAHIGLLPSYYPAESTPTAVIEYLLCGKPVIASNLGAIKEMISYQNQQAGKCLELQDGKVAIHDLTKAIEMYLLNPTMVEKHSIVALQAAEKFSMKYCVEQYIELFDQVAVGVPDKLVTHNEELLSK